MGNAQTTARPRAATASVNGAIGLARSARRAADLFKSLADPHRLRILGLLAEHGELNVSAIGTALGQSQPAVSHHLTQLRVAGLIEYRRDGKFNFYALSPTGLHDLFDHLFPPGVPAKLLLGGVELSFRRK